MNGTGIGWMIVGYLFPATVAVLAVIMLSQGAFLYATLIGCVLFANLAGMVEGASSGL